MGFAPQNQKKMMTSTSLDAVKNRREAFFLPLVAAAGIVALPKEGQAFQQQLEDHLTEPTQLPTGGRYDLNSATVGEYKQLRGMFPTVAGKIASNGPYETVADVYKIDNLTDRDVKMLKKYEKLFTVNPPGRAFKERINARVST
eukprot:41286_1